jgi:hypothetical protein
MVRHSYFIDFLSSESVSFYDADIRQFTYNIPFNIPEGSSIEFELRVNETIVNVPIAFEDLPLP